MSEEESEPETVNHEHSSGTDDRSSGDDPTEGDRSSSDDSAIDEHSSGSERGDRERERNGERNQNRSDETGLEAVTETAIETDEHPLAAVVAKPRSEAAIESLRAEGVYDDSRRVREYDGETVALPIAAPPADTRVREVVRQVDPERRNPGLEDGLRDRGWSDAELESVPGSWAVIGSVILVTVPEEWADDGDRGRERERDLGEALLELHGEAESVLADEGIANEGVAGTYREPRTRVIAGSQNTETIHTEHGTRYGLDPVRVMFSPGNQAERARMGQVVDPGERVFDMFAGIGYFSLPMARAGAQVTATEINPTAFRYLLENAMLNEVQENVDAYHTDCRDLATTVEADRVVMGYYGYGGTTGDDGHGDRDEPTHGTRTDEAHEFLAHALEALEPGGVIHYHESTPESRLWERPLERLTSAVEEGEGRALEILEKRRVKTHSAGVVHVVIDARVE